MPKVCEINTEAVKDSVVYYSAYDYDYSKYAYDYKVVKARGKQSYIDIFGTFDIESTTNFEIDSKGKYEYVYGYMYTWQVCFNGDVILGRYWEEFQYFIGQLTEWYQTSISKRLVIYVHFLEYEFQFMNNFFEWEDVFALDKRKVLKALTVDGIEFRCSYKLSNYGLSKFTQNMRVKHQKQDGEDFNYYLKRNPLTTLSSNELYYCICDVLGLWESIVVTMEKDGDSIATIPSTSTGYVRRDIKHAMESNEDNFYLFKSLEMDETQYNMCKDAFRGGNTHANRFFSGKKLYDLYSIDIASSYPYVIATKYFPVTAWKEIEPYDFYKHLDDKCVLFSICFYNISLKEDVAMPYISTSKCKKLLGAVYDNGRILSADFLEITLTEIDYKIIKSQYDIEEEICTKAYTAERGILPKELRDCMINVYFHNKCTLKNIDDYNYMKSKNKLNAIFGMMVMAIVRMSYFFFDNEWFEDEGDAPSHIHKYYNSRKNFLAYQWGIYVTAHARSHLQYMLDIIGLDAVYCDTDSIKFRDYKKYLPTIERINDNIRKECIEADIPAFHDYNGKRFFLGIWEKDENVPYDTFKTFGAKKYAYEKDGVLHITVSGMSKEKGVDAMENSIDNFELYRTYKDIGRTTSFYNDVGIHEITETDYQGNTCTFSTASNIGVVDTTYTLGVTDEYFEEIYKYMLT
ncbi:hypothetical protein [Bacteroides acidifaciens]|uniref:hypothetical protein n=1 Tax=Bacteroides acidifaciens TaxID=85831 RepID=UPI0025AEB17C|nr:hypothetical protein [Bacteroides acidifaciens]